MNKKNEKIAGKGSAYEGRDEAYVDIDRMINEGLSGGDVHPRFHTTNIEEAHDLMDEEPPHQVTE